MTNQEKARLRNWQKMRIMGITLDTSVLTPEEQALWREIQVNLTLLKANWDDRTATFLGHPLPPYKCYWCGKRSYAFHLWDMHVVCAKHLKQAQNDEREYQQERINL